MRRLSVSIALLLPLIIWIIAGCGGSKTTPVSESQPQAAEKPAEEGPQMVTTASGLKYIDLKEGEGREVTNGMDVTVHYTLWLDQDGQKGKLIQSSKERNQPFSFTVGEPGLIKGWNQGMLGMKPGGIRRLYIPSRLGYGVRGNPPVIPANADLIFEIELLKIG